MIKHLKNINELDNLVNTNSKIIIDCFATWCGPCRMLAPELEKLDQAHPEWLIIKVDVDQIPEIAQKFAFQAVPTIIYIVDKQLKKIESGYKPVSELEKIIERY